VILETSLTSPRLELRSLSVADVTQDYVDWLNDPITNQFLEVRFTTQTVGTVKEFVQKMVESPTDYLLGIYLRAANQHIGNLHVGPIDRHHESTAIGLMIGGRKFHGQGFGPEAISMISEHCFRQLGLTKLWAGCYESNQGSQKAFKKAGFHNDATLKDHCVYAGSRENVVIYSKFGSAAE